MKKTTLAATLLISSMILGGSLAQAADTTTYPVTGKSHSTVILTADDGTNGEGSQEGTGAGPGGGATSGGDENGGGGGDIIKPPAGETDEGGVVNPGQTSPLRLSLLSEFNFGTIKMSGNGGTYYAQPVKPNFTDGGREERPNFIQVTDNRGNNAGWNLSAKLSEQFKNGTSELTGAYLTLDNGWSQPKESELASYRPTVEKTAVISTTGAAKIAQAAENQGMGTWNILYGTLYQADQAKLGDAKKSVSLTIPSGLKMTEGQYTATIDWILNNTPQISE